MSEQDTRIETYIPLYRKYRPQTFADLVGQEAISQTLGNAIRLNKVAHAYLFCGPRGTGKTSTARIFAKSLNCECGPSETPCLQCASCTGVAQGTALDVIEFDAASNNGVADARELIENCQYSAMTGRFKIYIIDEVHMLTSQAFNALLKTLEEPPPNVIFIFATTEAHKVLPTIISRCQRFDFNRIASADIMARLAHIAKEESIRIDDEALDTIARHARGGLRDAVGLLDQVAVLGRTRPDSTVGRKDVAMFIGTLEEERLLHLSKAIAKRQAPELLDEIGALLNQGIEPSQLLRDLTMHFRNLLLVKAAGTHATPEILSLPADYFQQLRAQADLFPDPEELPQMIGRLSGVERNVRQSAQPQLWLEVGLLELTYRHEIYRIKALSERLDQLEAKLAGLSSAAPQPLPPEKKADPPRQAAIDRNSAHQPQASQSSKPTPTRSEMPSEMAQPPRPLPRPSAPSGESLEALYGRICAAVPSLIFRSLLQQQTFPLSLEGGTLLIGCPSDAHLTTIKKPDKFTHLQKSAEKILGAPTRVEVILEKKGSAKSPGKMPENLPASDGPPVPHAPSVPPATIPKPALPPMENFPPAQPADGDFEFDPPGVAPMSANGQPPSQGNMVVDSPAAQPVSNMMEALAAMDDDSDMPPMDIGLEAGFETGHEDEPPFFPDEDEFDEDEKDEEPPPPMSEPTGLNISSDEPATAREAKAKSPTPPDSRNPAWDEARHHVAEVLQGRLLE